MKTFEVKTINYSLYITSIIIFFVLALIVGLTFLPWILRNEHETIAILFSIVIVFVFVILLTKLFSKKRTINIDDKELTILMYNRVQTSIHLNNIVLLKVVPKGMLHRFQIYSSNKNTAFAEFNVSPSKSKIIDEIVQELTSYSDYIVTNPSNKFGGQWSEYVNKNAVQQNIQSIEKIHSKEKNSKNKVILIGCLFMVLLIAAPIFLILMNPNEFYKSKDGKMYYGKKEVIGVDPNEAVEIDYCILKDSSHIYYKDKILEWADRSTFKKLGNKFYTDRNGIYVETSGLLSSGKVEPLKGDYDKSTFQITASPFYYKDKNNLYSFDSNILNTSNDPLRKIEVEGLDAATFEFTYLHWGVDKDRVYFCTYDELRPCPEIDRNTFEVLSWIVAKDKNHVYYLTRGLASENKAATNKENYSILEGADAPSFYMIDNYHYADKNTDWEINK